MAFNYSDVTIDGNFREDIYAAARLRPPNFKAIDFWTRANAQDFSRIVGCEVTSSSGFQPAALEVASLPKDPRTDSVRV